MLKLLMMATTESIIFRKEPEHKKITVIRQYDAPVQEVWNAWTKSDTLDQWWAPKPWKARTKSMDFRPGGSWLYVMQGPDGTQQWSRFDFASVEPQEQFSGTDGFTDADGEINKALPQLHWTNTFKAAGKGTSVEIVIDFPSKEDVDKILEMGFEQGFTAGLQNLEDLLAG